MPIPVIFPANTTATDAEAWASSLGLRFKSDLHGNLVAVPTGENHGLS